MPTTRCDRLRQTISQPYIVAYMTSSSWCAAITAGSSRHRLRLSGGGLLSRLARDVVSVERYRTLADATRTRLKTLGYNNVDVVLGDGLAATKAAALRPDHRHRGAERVPDALMAQLAEDGIDDPAARPCMRSAAAHTVTKTSTAAARQSDRGAVLPLRRGQAREL